MSPEAYERLAVSDYEKVVKEVYEKYNLKLQRNNSVDFDDLLLLPIELFKKHPDILKRYQELYKYILIDEYQDTNEAQYILTKLLSEKNRLITCVGDDSQSIYSFRGANYKNILNFEKDYKDAKTILLEENYRSTSNILDAANQVIKNNKMRKDKNLWTSRGVGEKIKYYRAYNERDEVKSKEALNQAENQAEEWIHEMKNKDVNSGVKEETKDFMVKENSYLHVTLSLNEETSQYEITSYVLVDSSPDTDDETLQGL